MRIVRRISQIVFLVLFFLLFLLNAYPLASIFPVDFFLRIDPLIGLSASLSARTFIIKSIPAIMLLILTVFLGRFFCGWICPLGTIIDGSDDLNRSKPNPKTFSGKPKWIKFGILIFIVIGALFSIQLAGFFDPISLLTRVVVTFLYPIFVFISDGIIGFLYSFNFLESIVTRINEGMRAFLLPLSESAFRGSLVTGFIFVSILFLAIIHKRFWCRNLCPLGALLALFSKLRLYRRHVSEVCTKCNLCYRNCRMGAIGKDFKSTDNLECISCMDCQDICPEHAIRFDFGGQKKSVRVDLTRRRILGAGLTALFSASLIKISFSDPKNQGILIRPPGAREENQFLDYCIRCGECIRVCSTAGKGLQYTGLETGLEALWTPILFPETGYCEYNCNLCGQVCPTHAIVSLPLKEKNLQKIGTAHFDKTRCIPWYYGENCMVCEEHCPLPDKAIKFRRESIKTIDGRQSEVLLPYVDESLCIGCGICVTRCPVEGNRGIFLTNAGEERWVQ